MSEKSFFNCIFAEGILLMVLGLCILVLPKLTDMSFGVMLSVSFIIYGGYKIINSFFTKNYIKGIVLRIILGVYLLTLGVLLLLVPKVSLLWLIALIGIYYLMESLDSVSFIAQIRSKYNSWGCKLLSGAISCLIGILIVLGIPAMAFWVVAMFSGLVFLTRGMCKITLYNANSINNSY